MTNPDQTVFPVGDGDGPASAPAEAAVLTVDGLRYDLETLSEQLRLFSEDLIRTEQEWQGLQHRLRQFVAMESAMVNTLKQEVEQAGLEPRFSNEEPMSGDVPLLTIDGQTYDASELPEGVRLAVEDLVRNRQEREVLEFRLRQLDAARQGYGSAIREQLKASGAKPLDD